MSRYCLVTKPAPILNVPNFNAVFSQLPLDEKGLLRSVEMIALPGTKCKILSIPNPNIYEIATQEYPNGPLYIDARFTAPSSPDIPEREKTLPPREKILHRLKSSLGLPYIWGGNWGKGIPELASLYCPQKTSPLSTLSGVDCSGLLYEATDGYTPRNTSELFQFGEEIHSLNHVKPLDIFVWPGHVVIVLTSTHTIESLYGKGVILTPLEKRIADLPSHKIKRFCLS